MFRKWHFWYMMSSPHLKKYVGYLGESKLKKCRNCWLLQEVTISENWPSCSEGSRSTSSKQPEVSQGRAARQHGCARERRGPPPTLKAYVSEAMIYFPKHIPKKNHLDGFASSQQNNIILPSSFTTQVFSPHKIWQNWNYLLKPLLLSTNLV